MTDLVASPETASRTRVAAPAPDERPRRDLRGKVTGRTPFIEDLPNPPGVAHGATIRSTHAHARIRAIDALTALRMPGVLGIFDRDHLDGLNPRVRVGEYAGHTGEHGQSADQHLLSVDKVRFHGDLIGMIVAEDRRTALRAAAAVEVDYEPLPVVGSVEEALAPGAPLLHEDLESNLACDDSFEWGDVDAGLALADRIVDGTFVTPNAFHHPMEPVGSCIASWADDGVVLWLPTNKPFNPISQISELFGIDPQLVRVRVPEIGGAFGSKQLTPSMMAALALSRRLGRAVRVNAAESDSFRATARHAAVYRARVGITTDGQLKALDVQLDVDTGAYFSGARLVTRNMCISSWGSYRLPSFRVRARTAYTNKVPAASFRATGKTQTTFGVEALIDRAARELGIGAVEMRRRNALRRGERIASSWRVRGAEYPADTPPMDMDFEEMMRLATEAIGWDASSAEPPSTGPLRRGRGLALSLRHGAQGGGRTYAMATVDGRGIVRVSHAAPELGEGSGDMIGNVAARSLGLDPDRIIVEPPETQHGLNFEGAAAQRTTVHIGNAVQSACESLKRELVAATIEALGGTDDDWTVTDGAVVGRGRRITFGEIVGAFATAPSFEGHVVIKGLGSYSYPPSPDKAFGGLDHWSPGAVAVEIEVDTETGAIVLLQLAGVADGGHVIHYGSTRGQVEGGAVMGLALALSEEVVYEQGYMSNANAFHYRMATMRDIPPTFSAAIIANDDGPGPFGAKGLAQTSIPCVTPAIANAFLDATGCTLDVPPFTPEKVLRALGIVKGSVRA